LVTVTYAHHSLIQGNRRGALYGLVFTIILAVIFTAFQGIEYSVSSFTITDGAFGSCFYFGTGLIYGAPIIFNTKNTNNLTKSESKLSPYWVTGFSDAESTFSVKIAKDKSRFLDLRIVPVYAIELHIRDIEVLKKIREFFSVGSVTVRIRDGKSTGIYSVQSLKDLTKVIIPHFIKYPLLTQKQADFNLFSLLVNLMNNKEHLTEEGLNKIISIRASMNKGLTSSLKTIFPNVVGVERPIIINQIIKSPLWLVGFVDGEGCFYLKITKNKQVKLVFSISQHSRDKILFNIIKNYLNCGIIEEVSTRPNTVNLVVYKLEDILTKIVPIFEENSLITQKYLDFNYFREVSYLMNKKEHLTEEGLNKILLIKELKRK
jgi:Cytochrome c oxidase subunit III/LAGLIDADG endonuclease